MKPGAKKITGALLFFFAVIFTVSCHKEDISEAPIANVGKNDTIYGNKAELDGSASQGRIVHYEWTKTSGPADFHIENPAAVITTVDLEKGSYEFKLTTTDNRGASSTATKRIEVTDPELVFENLSWENDAANKMLLMQAPALPSLYLINRIRTVSLYGGTWFFSNGVHWFPVQKDGNSVETFYYKIVNDKVVAYKYYSVSPIVFGYSAYNKIKLLFE